MSSPRRLFIILLLHFIVLYNDVYGVKCLDCIGKDCMGNFCEGEYCILSYYAPRWGSHKWGSPQVIKGCMSGTMLEKDIKDHCEVNEEDEDDIFTCFCNSRDNCNGGKKLSQLKREPIELVSCECDGAHCNGESTCVGELCSYVVNHKTKNVEKGCVNASVPLIERRSMGSCMIPPITGAMHHNVAETAHDLLSTESCVCAKDYCNNRKPKHKVQENEKCYAFVNMDYMGSKISSKNITCTGEYCFKASIKSKSGSMKEYNTMGCASFLPGSQLAEELRAVGCATFESEEVQVEACYTTKDKNALARAKANQERKNKVNRKGSSRSAPKKGRKEEEEEIEIDYEEEEEEDESKKETKQKEKDTKKKEEEEEEEEEEGGEGGDEEDKEERKEKGGSKSKDESVEKTEATTVPHKFIFVSPTEPEIPDESNATMITVFVLIILCICVAGITWKFQLHRKLMRANYDTVAGG